NQSHAEIDAKLQCKDFLPSRVLALAHAPGAQTQHRNRLACRQINSRDRFCCYVRCHKTPLMPVYETLPTLRRCDPTMRDDTASIKQSALCFFLGEWSR